MNKRFLFCFLLFLALAAYGQQPKRIAIMNTEDDGEPSIKNSELTHLTDRLREMANKTLPKKNYAVMTQQSIVAFLGSQESMVKECRAAEGCLAKLGKKVNADYVGQGRIGRFGKDLTIKVELYESGSGDLVNSFTGKSKDIYGLLSVLEKEAPALFKQLPGVSESSATSPPVVGGISSLEKATDYDFGFLEIKPAYLDGIGKEVQWSLSINGEPYSIGEVRLSPNKYAVKLIHECYENISFNVGINKSKREVFNMAGNITLKKGSLDLNSEQNGKPASEPVFVNGKRVGETPFSGSVPICAKVEIGKNKEAVDVKLKYNEKIKYTHRGGFYEPGIANSVSGDPALKKCDAIFNPKKKFCYDGEIYDLCDGVAYNPTTHICSDDIANRALCNGVQYNPLIYECENNTLIAECGAKVYNPATHGCKNSTILPRCGTTELYNPKTHYCKDNTVFTRCGKTIYDPVTHFCEDNTVFPKCGATIYDPATQGCKDNTVFPRCGATVYDPATHGCKYNTVFPKCGATIYDPATQVCKDNTVLNKCGATAEFYNPKTHECRFGGVFAK